MLEKRYRMRRVNEALREVLSAAIGRGLKDPRVGFVTVTAVETTSDLRQARVFVSVFGKEVEKKETLKGLHSAEGFLQGVINAELHLKRTPTLEFVYDESIDRGLRMDALLRAETRWLPDEAGTPDDAFEGDTDGGPEGDTPPEASEADRA
ncbi:MAG: 30S ribosome-binding factor RbfA [Thermoleophilia bacterium]